MAWKIACVDRAKSKTVRKHNLTSPINSDCYKTKGAYTKAVGK